MKRKTYRNFMIIANKLQREKGYNQQEAFDLSHKVFENVENDGAGRTAEFFYGMIVSKSEFEYARNNVSLCEREIKKKSHSKTKT